MVGDLQEEDEEIVELSVKFAKKGEEIVDERKDEEKFGRNN